MSINKVILLGNAGSDAELRTTNNGTAVAKVRIATTERWKNHSGEYEDHVEWHTVRCWRNTAEYVGKYVKKGTTVALVGKLTTETWEKDGEKRSQTIIETDEVTIIRKDAAQPTDREERKRPRQELAAPKPQPAKEDFFDERSDDLPF